MHVTSPAQTRDVAGPAANYAPLATNRYAQLAATAAIEQKDKAGPPPLSSPTSPTAPIAPHAASIDKPDKSQRSPLVDSREAEPPMRKSPGPPLPSAPGSARPDSEAERLDRDVARLRSVGLTIEQVEMVQQLWRPIRRADVSSGDGESADRSMELKVDFGFVSQEDAKAALAEAAFPDDPARQKRYKAFLEAQAGESRDYYTVRARLSPVCLSAQAELTERLPARPPIGLLRAACRVQRDEQGLCRQGAQRAERRHRHGRRRHCLRQAGRPVLA